MTGTEIKTRFSKNQDGGVKAAVLFWSGLVLLALTTIAISHFTLGSRDTLLTQVPNEAKIYVHAQGKQTDIALRFMPELSALHPTEAATFALTEDGGLQWTSLLRWHWLSGPTEHELTQLNALDAQKIGRNIYLVGMTNFITNDGHSLSDNNSIRRALSSARGLSYAQSFVDLSSMDIGQEGIRDLMPANKIVLAITRKNSNRITIRSADIDSWNNFTNRNNQEPAGMLPPLMILPDEQIGVSLSLSESVELITELLFADTIERSDELDVPDSNQRDQAWLDLLGQFSGPTSLMLANYESADAKIRFAVYYPNLNAKDLMSGIEKYINTAFPASQTFKRPDGKTEREFFLNKELIMYGPEAFGGIRMLITEDDEEIKYPLKDLESGVILASDTEMLLLGEKSLEKYFNYSNYCTLNASETIYLNNPIQIEESLPFLRMFFDFEQVIDMIIQKSGDKWVYFCG